MADPPTLARYLADWLETQRTRLEPSTWASYRGNVERYLLPALGDRRLDELNPAELTVFYARLLRCGGRGGRGLSVRTVQFCHSVLRRALADAVRHELVRRNAASLATCPRRDPDAEDSSPPLPRLWTPEQTRAFLAFAADDPLRDLWEVAIGTGMRRGELLGLRWDDVDLDRRLVRVRAALSVVDGAVQLKPTKTNRARSLHVDDAVTAALRRRRAQQRADQASAGATWTDRWQPVFTDNRGQPLDPLRVTQSFARLVRRAPVPAIRLHDLRHLHASHMLAAGVPVPVVSQRLGHTQVSMTLDIYAHVLPAMDADAVERFARHIYGDEPLA